MLHPVLYRLPFVELVMQRSVCALFLLVISPGRLFAPEMIYRTSKPSERTA